MGSKKPALKTQPSLPPKATRLQFKPFTVWTEDPFNHILLVYLPGFKKEEIEVQPEKLLIKGSRQVADNKYLDVDHSFDVPKSTIVENISGRFEDGRLTLMMPKRVVEEQEATQKATSEEKGKEPTPEEKPYSAEGRKEEETIQKMKSKIREICVDKPKEISNRISIWRGDEDRWLDSGSLDGMLEKLNRNRKVIAAALVAFSVGFYVSHTLRTSARQNGMLLYTINIHTL